jgi:hypothetical protein
MWHCCEPGDDASIDQIDMLNGAAGSDWFIF